MKESQKDFSKELTIVNQKEGNTPKSTPSTSITTLSDLNSPSSTNENSQMEVFNKILAYLPPKNDKQSVWNQIYGSSESGLCLGCNKTTLYMPGDNWHRIAIFRKAGIEQLFNTVLMCWNCIEKAKFQENIIDWLFENQQFKNLKLLLVLLLVRYKDILSNFYARFASTPVDSLEILAKKVYLSKKFTPNNILKLDNNDITQINYCDDKDNIDKVRVIRNKNDYVKQLDNVSTQDAEYNNIVSPTDLTINEDEQFHESPQSPKLHHFKYQPNHNKGIKGHRNPNSNHQNYFTQKSRFIYHESNNHFQRDKYNDKYYGRINSFDTEGKAGITKGIIEYYYKPTSSHRTVAFFIEDVINRNVYIKKFMNCEFYIEGNYAKQIRILNH